MINVIIPMAGPSDTVVLGETETLKNLSRINDKPFIKFFLEKININGNFIFITQEKYERLYGVTEDLESIINKPNIVKINGFEKGAALTILKLRDKLDMNVPVIISNSDYLIDWDSKLFLNFVEETKCDGCLVTYQSNSPKHSYCKINQNGEVTEVAEKTVISSNANVGLYYWSSAKIMFESIEKMVRKKITHNDLYYISLSYNELISSNKKILIYPIKGITIFDSEKDILGIKNKIK